MASLYVTKTQHTLEVQDEVHQMDGFLRNGLGFGVRKGSVAPEPIPEARGPRLKPVDDDGVDVLDDEVVGQLRELHLVREGDGLEVDVLELVGLAGTLPEQPGPPLDGRLPPVFSSALLVS